ncbi:acyl-CoA synthetase (AMP-forming)/AMP-acid ligase II [Thiovulum sp. ES]|nr:acyl-CoA synthetase (AMP-forming)/AMP-acid ligase II [Thiovulum sp. ES]
MDFRKKTINDILGEKEIYDVLISILQKEISLLRKEHLTIAKTKSWGYNASMNGNILRLDSLELVTVATRTNLFFELHKTGGIEELLLSERKIGDWIQIIQKANQENLSFFSSGTTGNPEGTSHKLEKLEKEAKFWVEKIQPKRVISLVPQHHIYGFIFAILVPKVAGVSREFKDPIPTPRLKFALEEGDLIVMTPYLIELFADFNFKFPFGVSAVCSTAPLSSETRERGLQMGLQNIFEIYGSTETSGIGWKNDNSEGFLQLPFLEEDVFPDQIEWFYDSIRGENRFKILGRFDSVIQIAGNNVNLEETKERILRSELLQDLVLRLDGDRLKMFAILKNETDKEELQKWLFENLESSERPTRIEYGTELPKNEIGKLADW